MSQTNTPLGRFVQPDGSGRARGDRVVSDQLGGLSRARHSGIGYFVRHFVEMMVAMMIGMCLGVGIFTAVLGVSYKRLVRQDPSGTLILMAVSMAIPMVAWMRFRRHTWRNAMEMGGAMVLPAVPFLACIWAHVFYKAPNGPYMMVSIAAMLALMLYRWKVYSAHPVRRIRTSTG